MADVVAHEVVERRRLAGRHRLPGQPIQVVPGVLPQPHGVGNRAHHPRQVIVVGGPEREELRPRRRLVLLRRDPRVLVVAGEDQIVLPGGADEALVVVGRRVDEMADDLLRGPLAWRGPPGGVRVRNLLEARMRGTDGGDEIVDVIHG